MKHIDGKKGKMKLIKVLSSNLGIALEAGVLVALGTAFGCTIITAGVVVISETASVCTDYWKGWHRRDRFNGSSQGRFVAERD